jgi:hypothetical protein
MQRTSRLHSDFYVSYCITDLRHRSWEIFSHFRQAHTLRACVRSMSLPKTWSGLGSYAHLSVYTPNQKTAVTNLSTSRIIFLYSGYVWSFSCGEGLRSRRYGRIEALRLILCNPVRKTIHYFVFPCNGGPVEWKWYEKTEVLGGKTCPSSTLSTTNPIENETGPNQDLSGKRPATNRLSHGTAMCGVLYSLASLSLEHC